MRLWRSLPRKAENQEAKEIIAAKMHELLQIRKSALQRTRATARLSNL
jgi:hypothetical protein